MDNTNVAHKHKWLTRYITFKYRYECASGMQCECGAELHQDEVEALVNLAPPHAQPKLYVAGATSPHPQDWSGWDEISLALAENSAQAGDLTGKTPVIEVDTSKPCLLCSMPSPEEHMGADA